MADKTNSCLQHAFATFLGFVSNPIVKPGEGGLVASSGITDNDVLIGRGLLTDKHSGNVEFRKIQ
jgi:hypothetical protein